MPQKNAIKSSAGVSFLMLQTNLQLYQIRDSGRGVFLWVFKVLQSYFKKIGPAFLKVEFTLEVAGHRCFIEQPFWKKLWSSQKNTGDSIHF